MTDWHVIGWTPNTGLILGSSRGVLTERQAKAAIQFALRVWESMNDLSRWENEGGAA